MKKFFSFIGKLFSKEVIVLEFDIKKPIPGLDETSFKAKLLHISGFPRYVLFDVAFDHVLLNEILERAGRRGVMLRVSRGSYDEMCDKPLGEPFTIEFCVSGHRRRGEARIYRERVTAEAREKLVA